MGRNWNIHHAFKNRHWEKFRKHKFEKDFLSITASQGDSLALSVEHRHSNNLQTPNFDFVSITVLEDFSVLPYLIFATIWQGWNGDITSVLKLKKQSLKEKQIIQDHTVRIWQCQDLNPSIFDFILSTMLNQYLPSLFFPLLIQSS